MKISTEQMKALQESEARRKPATVQEGFNDLLSEQLQHGQTQSTVPAMDMQSAMLQGLIPVTLPQEVTGVASVAAAASDAAVAAAMNRVEGVFSGVEEYASQLAGQGGATLRTAYTTLEGMGKEIASLKAAYPDMGEKQPELAAMVNELDVLVQTETFKFNRGDYF